MGRRARVACLALACSVLGQVRADQSWGHRNRGKAPPLNTDTSARPPAFNPDAYDAPRYAHPVQPSAPPYEGPEDDWGVDYVPPPPPPTRRGRQNSSRAKSSRRGNFDEYDHYSHGAEGDLVDQYMQTAKGKALVSAGSAGVGAALGAAISETFMGKQTPFLPFAGFCIGLIFSMADGAFGDLFKALGLGIILSAARSWSIGSMYPVLPQISSALHLGRRRVFPPGLPGDSPWKYKAAPGGVEFRMMKAVIAVAFMAALAGYVLSKFVPLLPDVLASVAAAAFFGYMTTLDSSGGDLARVIGMRLIALFDVIAGVDEEVGAFDKASVVGKLCFSKLLFWDKKYQVTGKAASLVSGIAAKARNAAANGDDGDYSDNDRYHRGAPPPPPQRGGQRRRRDDDW